MNSNETNNDPQPERSFGERIASIERDTANLVDEMAHFPDRVTPDDAVMALAMLGATPNAGKGIFTPDAMETLRGVAGN